MCRLSWNLGVSASWNPQGLSRPVMRLRLHFILCTKLITAAYFSEVYILTERLKNFWDRSSCSLFYTRFVHLDVCTYFNTILWTKALKYPYILVIKHPNGGAWCSPLVHPVEVVRAFFSTPPHFPAVRVGGDGCGGGFPLSTRNREGSQSWCGPLVFWRIEPGKYIHVLNAVWCMLYVVCCILHATLYSADLRYKDSSLLNTVTRPPTAH